MSVPKPDYTRIVPAMVALARPQLPLLDKLIARLQEAADLEVNLDLVKAADEGLMVGLDHDRGAVVLSRMPIPWNAIEGPAATAWWWPEATATLQNHVAHLLVVVAGEQARSLNDRLQRHKILTQLTAAVASLCDAKGIYWVAGGMVHESRSFIAETHRMVAGRLPISLWIDIRIEPLLESANNMHYRMFTTGMQALGELELEIAQTTRSIPEILDFTRAVAQHLLTASDPIEDGHTLGRSDEEKVTIARATSMLDEKMTVWRLEFV